MKKFHRTQAVAKGVKKQTPRVSPVAGSMVDAAHPEAVYSHQREVKRGSSFGQFYFWAFSSSVYSYAEMFYILFCWLKMSRNQGSLKRDWVIYHLGLVVQECKYTVGWGDSNVLAWQA